MDYYQQQQQQQSLPGEQIVHPVAPQTGLTTANVTATSTSNIAQSAASSLHSQQVQQQEMSRSSTEDAIKRSLLPERSTISKGKYSLTDFSIMRTLGTGSFGRVHLVRSVHNGRYYAIKVLKNIRLLK